eukprot:TRINITY_DN2368_c2_g2_i1.p1 TRINITY_DN2368_c2_g2~~TRINITY_DN2368_c2_g2_i1.p1  ORF type:complete len:188 (+),score=2.57 TRINITY_DN2368_c2_g2_i1:433-996(+)
MASHKMTPAREPDAETGAPKVSVDTDGRLWTSGYDKEVCCWSPIGDFQSSFDLPGDSFWGWHHEASHGGHVIGRRWHPTNDSVLVWIKDTRNPSSELRTFAPDVAPQAMLVDCSGRTILLARELVNPKGDLNEYQGVLLVHDENNKQLTRTVLPFGAPLHACFGDEGQLNVLFSSEFRTAFRVVTFK